LLNAPEKGNATGLEYLYEGHCRQCNKSLTSPLSIKSGIGPVCAGGTKVQKGIVAMKTRCVEATQERVARTLEECARIRAGKDNTAQLDA
jgi:hypothetical protein